MLSKYRLLIPGILILIPSCHNFNPRWIENPGNTILNICLVIINYIRYFIDNRKFILIRRSTDVQFLITVDFLIPDFVCNTIINTIINICLGGNL